jgi:hypothetical protein
MLEKKIVSPKGLQPIQKRHKINAVRLELSKYVSIAQNCTCRGEVRAEAGHPLQGTLLRRQGSFRVSLPGIVQELHLHGERMGIIMKVMGQAGHKLPGIAFQGCLHGLLPSGG